MVNLPQNPSSQDLSPIVSSQNLGWESIIVEEFEQPPGSGEFNPEKEHIIALCLATKPYRVWQSIGDRSYTGIYTKGDLSITPAELPCSYKAYGYDHYLEIRIRQNFLTQVATETVNTNIDRLELITEFRDHAVPGYA